MTNRVHVSRCRMILTNILAFRLEDPDEFNRHLDMLQDLIWTFDDIEACFELLDSNEIPDVPSSITVENVLYERISFLISQFKKSRHNTEYAVQKEMF